MARPSKQHEIGIWLKGLLGAGCRTATDVIAAAVASGYATNSGDGTRTLRRVKTALGIVSKQEGEVWYWRDPAVEQAKPVSEDKLDVLTHKVEEAIRLSKPVVPAVVAGPEPTSLTSKKSRPYDKDDPQEKAIAEQYKREQERFEAIENVVTSTDPFAVIGLADSEEIDRMMLYVRNHLTTFGPDNGITASEKEQWDFWLNVAKARQRELSKAKSAPLGA